MTELELLEAIQWMQDQARRDPDVRLTITVVCSMEATTLGEFAELRPEEFMALYEQTKAMVELGEPGR